MSCRSMMVCFFGLILSTFLLAQADARKERNMASLDVSIDGQKVAISAAVQGDAVFVALDTFCEAVNAEAKTLEANGPLAVCRDDLCIPLNVSGTEDTLTVEGVLFGRLAAFGDPLGLKWTQNNGSLVVTSGQAASGLGIGNTPPSFTLPDLYSGEAVSLSDYRGKKTVFYMWASW